MRLLVIMDCNVTKVNEFYKNLVYNIQALETLGKLDRVSGLTSSIFEKLKGIKTDLVRGSEGWQDWDLARLVQEMKKWRDINVPEATKKQRKSHIMQKTVSAVKGVVFTVIQTTTSQRIVQLWLTLINARNYSLRKGCALTVQDQNIVQQTVRVYTGVQNAI